MDPHLAGYHALVVPEIVLGIDIRLHRHLAGHNHHAKTTIKRCLLGLSLALIW